MKDNFLLKKSHQEIFNELSKEEAGELIKGIFQYVNTGESGLSGVLNAVFIPIKNFIDENEKKYQVICERNKQNGLNGGRPKREEKEENPKNPVGYSGLENETQKTQMVILGQNPHISYITNNIDNNLEEIGYGEEKPLLVTGKAGSLVEITKKVIEHLNTTTGAKFRSSSKATQSKIKARLNEGYTLNDFIVVIDKKYNEWKNTEFEKYLCPETLFGTKFEKYLNQREIKKNEKREENDFWKND